MTARKLTAEEFFYLPDSPDGPKQELVKGVVVTTPARGFEHGKVKGNVAFHLFEHVKPIKLGTVVFSTGVVTERDDDTVRGPDVSFYSKKRVPLGRRIVKYADVSPDLCVEVVSPSNTKRELRDKTKEYFAAGVKLVWIVDPEDRSVTVLTSPNQGTTFYEPSELTGGDVLPGFSCPIADLFE